MSEVQAANLHVCDKEPYQWRLFTEWDNLPALEDVTLEVRHRFPVETPTTVNAAKLNSACAKLLFGLVVTVNELFLVHFEGLELVCRLVNLTPEETGGADADEMSDLTLPDHYIGLMEAGTRIYVEVDEAVCKSTLFIEGGVSKAAAPLPKDIVTVTTLVDDEQFPVKTKLLRPCLALTSAVQAGKGVHADAVREVSVNTDCCTFDRVLLFLEAQFKGRSFDILPEHLEDMSAAAEVLKLQPLKDLCDKKRGAFESRVRKEPISFDEIVARNTRGGDNPGDQETLLLMDGMVFDITRWLPEHPGGSTIIPEQALNMDSTVFFEIYHVSRQSFLYLKEFYIGELREDDLAIVPKSRGVPSAGFLEQLKAHTPWRLDFVNNPAVHKSF
jgi:cytochrome b involved in lipid metabolism